MPLPPEEGRKLTQRHLNEASRFTDRTLPLAVADTYFLLQWGTRWNGGCSLRIDVLVAMDVMQRPEQAKSLFRALLDAELVGVAAYARVRSESLAERVRALRRLGLAFSEGGEARLCQLLRLHRAELVRDRLFDRYIAQQYGESLRLNRALKRWPDAPEAARQQRHTLAVNVVWARAERDRPPSRRAANHFLRGELACGDPLLPTFCAATAKGERCLQVAPPPHPQAATRAQR